MRVSTDTVRAREAQSGWPVAVHPIDGLMYGDVKETS